MDTQNVKLHVDNTLTEWREKEMHALELLKVVGDLRFNKGIELVIFRNEIFDSKPSQILQNHQISKNYIKENYPVELSLSLAKTIANIESLTSAKIDIGTLAIEWLKEKSDFETIAEFVHFKLRDILKEESPDIEPKNVVLYGFGRIGRLLAKRIIEVTGKGNQLRLKAIVLRPKMTDIHEEIKKRMALFVSDSVHGNFTGTLELNSDDSEVIINGNRIKIILAKDPSEVNYRDYGIEETLVIDNTGVWRNKKALSAHLKSGASHVILTAPGKDIPNIVYGINQNTIDRDKDNVLSAASCTTNAISPVIGLIEKEFGIKKGHIETIHAYTSDQNLLDNFHKKPRRGRAAAVNMVLTTTGAASAVSKVIPSVAGKLTGNAVRVPTPNVSLAIMYLDLEKSTSLTEVQAYMKEASLKGDMVEQIHFSESTEFVSSHAIGATSTCVIDAPSTQVSHDGKSIVVYAWYDNEYGYCCQVVRLAKHVAKVRRKVYY